MCGIAALITSDNHDTPSATCIINMLSTLTHRGPDDSAYASFANGQALLAHARLAIVDLGAGPQPFIYNQDEYTYAISYSGEIYDIESLRSRLSSELEFSFRTRTDTEVVLMLYIRYGLQMFRYLNGEWSFVLWDGKLSRVVAARDRFGIKPLFYHKHNRSTYFASECKALLTIPSCKREFSSQFLSQAIFGAYSRSDSPFTDIKTVEPGQYRIVNFTDQDETAHYWQPTYTTNRQMSLLQATDGLRARLALAVERRMKCDVPFCTYLSGGIDSAVVTGLASKHHKFEAYHISFTNSEFDESLEAEKIAKHYGVELVTIQCPVEILADHVEEAIYHTEMSTPNASLVGKYLLSQKLREDGIKVALTGEGSDEILADYPFFKLEKLWRLEMGEFSEPTEATLNVPKLFEEFKITERRSEGLLWNDNNKWKSFKRFMGYYSASYIRAVTFGAFKNYLLSSSENAAHTSNLEPSQMFDEHDWAHLSSLHPLHISMVQNFRHLTSWIFPCLGDRLEMCHDP